MNHRKANNSNTNNTMLRTSLITLKKLIKKPNMALQKFGITSKMLNNTMRPGTN